MSVVTSKEFYVYAHRTTAGRLFYIGKGCGKRAWDVVRRGTHWRNIVKKHGGFQVEIIVDGLQEWAALEIEQEQIALHGRSDCGHGPLINKTDGGEGVSGAIYTAERRAAIGERARGEKNGNFGKPMSEGQRKKLSEAKLGKRLSEETKAKLSAARKGAGSYWFGKKRDSETVAKIVAANTGRKHSEESKQKISEASRKVQSSPEYRSNHSQTIKEWWAKRKLQAAAESRSSP